MKVLTLVLCFACLMLRAADDVVLSVAGTLRVTITVPAKPDRLEQLAAKELTNYLTTISGQAPPAAGPLPIVLGELSEAHRQALLARGGAPGSFALVVTGDRISIGGLEPIGTLYGAYELLEQLGVRWYMPGELGTVLPAGDYLAVPIQETLQAPSFTARAISGAPGDWRQRNRLGGVSPPSQLKFPDPAPFAERPELYALVNGERRPEQLCVSNPETLRLEVEALRAYFTAKPTAIWAAVSNHGSNHCECETCRALDPPEHLDSAFTGGINLNDRYVWFCNRLLEALAPEFPDKRLALTVCTPQFQPPSKIKGHPNLDVLAWANGFCRFHGVSNPACPQRQHVLELEKGWVAMLQGNFYERTNWGNIAGPGLPLPAVHRYRRDYPAYHAAGVKGVSGADYSHLISQLPGSYIGAKLLWNHEADVEALLSDFYSKFYGPAASSMRAYHELLEATVRDAPFHAGSAIDFPRIYPPTVRLQARQYLRQAQKAAPAAPYSDRLAAISLDLDYLDSFCEMIAARDRCDFAAAKDALDHCLSLIDDLQTQYKPPLLNRSFASVYLKLFFGNAIEDGWRKGVAEGQVRLGLDPVWEFRRDGVEDWQPQPTWTSSWSSQGLGDYDGVAWYRQTFDLPAGEEPLHLWFGGVDETLTAWLNGTEVGSHTGAFQAFEFDVSEAARRGETNTLLLRIGNHTLDEVGTGGLLAPVMLYSPTPPK